MTKYLLSFLIVLLSGYGQMTALSLKSHSSYSIKNFNPYEDDFSALEQDEDLIFKAASSGGEEESFKIIAAENEVKENELDEDDATSFTNHLDGYYISSLFLSEFTSFFLSHERIIPNHEHFSYPSYNRHILFQVFRI